MEKNKNWFRRHPIWTGIIGLFIFIIILGAFSDDRGTESTDSSSSIINTDSPEKKVEVIEITARDLFLAYERNEIAADEKYADKTLKISGTIADFGKDIWDNSYIQFINPYVGVRCTLKDSEVPKVVNFNKGDDIILQGVNTGKLLDVNLEECVIL